MWYQQIQRWVIFAGNSSQNLWYCQDEVGKKNSFSSVKKAAHIWSVYIPHDGMAHNSGFRYAL